MSREIKLSGSQISVLKSIGLSGGQIAGKTLLENVESVEKGEFLETLTDLIEMDYVVCDKVNIRKFEDVERAFFRVSPNHARDLRDAMNPSRERERNRGRRQRRG